MLQEPEPGPGVGTLDFEIRDNEILVYPSTRQAGSKKLFVERGIRNILDYKMKERFEGDITFDSALLLLHLAFKFCSLYMSLLVLLAQLQTCLFSFIVKDSFLGFIDIICVRKTICMPIGIFCFLIQVTSAWSNFRHLLISGAQKK